MSLSVQEIKSTIKHHEQQKLRCESYLADAQRRLEKRDALITKYKKLLEQAENPVKAPPVLKKAAEKKIVAAKEALEKKPAKKELKKASTPAGKLVVKKQSAPASEEQE